MGHINSEVFNNYCKAQTRMLHLRLLTLFVAIATASADWVKPAYCNGLDCPVFEVFENATEYELRRYSAAMWVSTQYTAMTPDEADEMARVAFNRLFEYISGQNENKEKINMTAPVVIEVTPGAGPNCVSTFVMSFY